MTQAHKLTITGKIGSCRCGWMTTGVDQRDIRLSYHTHKNDRYSITKMFNDSEPKGKRRK